MVDFSSNPGLVLLDIAGPNADEKVKNFIKKLIELCEEPASYSTCIECEAMVAGHEKYCDTCLAINPALVQNKNYHKPELKEPNERLKQFLNDSLK